VTVHCFARPLHFLEDLIAEAAPTETTGPVNDIAVILRERLSGIITYRFLGGAYAQVSFEDRTWVLLHSSPDQQGLDFLP
jgi:hypothetical protein